MNSVQLHTNLVQTLSEMGVCASESQRNNLAMVCQGLAVGADCHLATVALGIPLRGRRSRFVQRFSRWLQNERLLPSRCYRAVVRHLFAHWSGCEVNLVMDRTDIENRWSILTLGVAYRKRALPLAWEVLPFGGTSAECQINLLKRVQPYLPALETVRVSDSRCGNLKGYGL